MRARIAQELELLRAAHGVVDHAEDGGEDWFHLPAFPFPEGWRIGDQAIQAAPVLFKLPASYPSGAPYGFMTPGNINFKGSAPGNTAAVPASPFPGQWLLFSWQPDGNWQPAAEIGGGSNLLSWARSFAQRLKEGA